VRSLRRASASMCTRYSKSCERSRLCSDQGWFDDRERHESNKPLRVTGTALRWIPAGEPSLVGHVAGPRQTGCWGPANAPPGAGQGPAAVRHLPAMPPAGRLDRAADDVRRGDGRQGRGSRDRGGRIVQKARPQRPAGRARGTIAPLPDGPRSGTIASTVSCGKKGDRSNLCEVPFGPFRQIGPVPFLPPRLCKFI
jgi:hypothetical protein